MTTITTITPTVTDISGDGTAYKITWAHLLYVEFVADPPQAEVQYAGIALAKPEFVDRSIQVLGTFGGGTVVIEGSVDGTNYKTLTDPQGNALSVTAAKIEAVSELVSLIRPRTTAGAIGVTDLTVALIVRRPQPLRT